jgi:Ca2+-binding RTX toxin-like protein
MIDAVINNILQNRVIAGLAITFAAVALVGTAAAGVAGAIDNTPPSITVDIANRCVSDTAGKMFLSLSDAETPAGQLAVTAVSSDQTIVPDSAVSIGILGSVPGRFRTLDVETQPRTSGTALLTVTVSDGIASTTLMIPVIVGTRADDGLFGTDQPDMIFGVGGDDILGGGGGNDLICGGKGRDTMSGGSGADSFDGGLGQDTVVDANPNEGDVDFGT